VSVDTIERGIDAVVTRLGFELVTIDRGGGRRRPLLRLRVDRLGGVPGKSELTVDDCAVISAGVREWLDETGQAGENYILEVSSPGVERPLVRQSDYERFAGLAVRLRGFGPLAGGERQVEGILRGVREEGDEGPVVVLEAEDGELIVPLAGIARANLVYRPEIDL
jgi:ribosome maturation factor RimP